MVQLSSELQQLQGLESDKKFQSDLELLAKVFKAFRCYYMALTCQGNRQWAEALALYQRAETYINQAEGKKLADSEFAKYGRVGQDLAHLRSQVNSGKCAAHAQNILGVEDINAAMSGLSVRSKKVCSTWFRARKTSSDNIFIHLEFVPATGWICGRCQPNNKHAECYQVAAYYGSRALQTTLLRLGSQPYKLPFFGRKYGEQEEYYWSRNHWFR